MPLEPAQRFRGPVLADGEAHDLYVVDCRITYEPQSGADTVAEGWIVPGPVDAHCHLGEVAIVDCDSAAARTGLVHKDMLFDENVGSHVAWGTGYTSGMDGSLELSADQRVAEGLNQSDTHVDIVIGSPEVQIDGIHADGSVVAVTGATSSS